jgi:hypothetical protein
MAKPSEEWLVVFHKEFKAEIEKRLADNKRVHLVHWGEHQATNDYAAVPNVILAGTLFYRPSYYEALTRLVVDRRPVQGGIDPAMEKDVTIGEHVISSFKRSAAAVFESVKAIGALPATPTSSPPPGIGGVTRSSRGWPSPT